MKTEQQSGYQIWQKYGGEAQAGQPILLGPHISYEWRNSRRKIIFTAASYKFAMKMIGNMYEPDTKEILELGCNDGFGTHFVAEFAKRVVGVDFDENAVELARKNIDDNNIEFICDDFLNKKYGEFDAVVSFDVIEHICHENEDMFMQTVLKNLKNTGTLILGTPTLEQQQYAAECVVKSHINVYKGEDLYRMLKKYFHNVYLFTQNDEIIHTGYLRMANGLIAVCANRK